MGEADLAGTATVDALNEHSCIPQCGSGNSTALFAPLQWITCERPATTSSPPGPRPPRIPRLWILPPALKCYASSVTRVYKSKELFAERSSRNLACSLRCTLSLDRAQHLALVSLYLARFLSGRQAPATVALAPARTSQILAHHDRSNRFCLHRRTQAPPRAHAAIQSLSDL